MIVFRVRAFKGVIKSRPLGRAINPILTDVLLRKKRKRGHSERHQGRVRTEGRLRENTMRRRPSASQGEGLQKKQPCRHRDL